MESRVGLRALRQRRCIPHLAAGPADFGHLPVGSPRGRQRRRLGFDDVTELLHGDAESPACRARSHTSVSTSRSSRFQRSLRLDPAADLGPRNQQALGHQHLDRLAHR